MYKLISLANLVNNINYEKINHIKNEVSYIKDILSIHNYELVDLASEWLQRDFIPVFCNSQGDVLPSFAQYQYNKSTNLMLCTIIHNKINSNSNSHRMKMFYSLTNTDGVHYYYTELHCIVDDIGDIYDINISDSVYCTPTLKDLYSSFTFILVKDAK